MSQLKLFQDLVMWKGNNMKKILEFICVVGVTFVGLSALIVGFVWWMRLLYDYFPNY
jgi:hypothetical protein